jgi:hypothetical protein
MKEKYNASLKAHVLTDTTKRVRAIRHSQEYWESDKIGVKDTSISYFKNLATTFNIPAVQLNNLHQKANHLLPLKKDVEYQSSEEKNHFDASTLGFAQTYLNTPVWNAGFKVTVKQGPSRVIRSVDTSHVTIKAKLPSQKVIDQYTKLFTASNRAYASHRHNEREDESENAEAISYVRTIANLNPTARRKAKDLASSEQIRFIRGRFWIYKYDAADRFEKEEDLPDIQEEPEHHHVPSLALEPVDGSIKEGAYYLVAEVTFEVKTGMDRMVWRALIELETNSVLYLRALSDNASAMVFKNDPISKTGNTALDSASTSATLDPHQDDIVLQNLDAPAAGVQSLSGTYAEVTQFEGPDITPPTENTGIDFDYETRTNDFASVSGYYHVDRIFREIADLGFDLATYFSNTTFPIPVDIRCFDNINAHCVGNGLGGIGHVGYGLMDTTDLVNKLGRACDPRVHWHEVCGHGILYEGVGTANFGFAHSAGDGLSGIYFDPESNCKGVDGTPVGKPGDLRFTYVPWHPSLHRRFDREIASGWAWGGSQDNSGYKSEEILATTHFNIYRAIGGDSTSLGRRKFASRMAIYLILRAIQNLTPASNPAYAREFAAELMTVDALNWTSEGIFGGAYGKVIRWAFEKQGEYQSPLIVNGGPGDGSVTTAGDPPDIDVYINDGRDGEYDYQAVHWNTTTVWNRRSADGLSAHEEPELGSTNYMYVKVKNRGTQQANNVVVKGYHTKPGAGLLWPSDFESFTTSQIAVGTLNANNSEERIVGPFEWTPNTNAYGHDCVLMVVSADGDPANIDNFTAGESIPLWRLVPNDNNTAQRNVYPVAGGGGSEGLMASLSGFSFWVRNPNPRRAIIDMRIQLPKLLEEKGWRLTFEGLANNQFTLASGVQRELVMRLHAGSDFTPEQVAAEPAVDILIEALADDNPIGGMTYRLNPNIKVPHNSTSPCRKKCCKSEAQDLIDCLGVKGKKVKSAKINEIILGIKLDTDCCDC